MGMTDRDKKLLGIFAVIIVLGGYWFLVLGKKKAAVAEAEIAKTSAQQELDQAIAAEKVGAQEKKRFPVSYARVVKLGKAIPSDTDFSSFLVQINDVTAQGDVTFLSLTTSGEGAATAGISGPVGNATTTCDAGGTAATGATGAPTAATGATGPTVANSGVGQAINDANAGAAAGNADANRAGSSTADAAALCQSAPTLTDLAAAAAGLEVINYNLTFEGSYFKLHEVFGRLMDLVRTRNGKVRTVGRLVQINSIALSVGDFPKLQASVAMTGYQLPSTISATAGATPAGPAGAPAPTAAPAATTPPQAVAGAR